MDPFLVSPWVVDVQPMEQCVRGEEKVRTADYELSFEYLNYTNEYFKVKVYTAQSPEVDSR